MQRGSMCKTLLYMRLRTTLHCVLQLKAGGAASGSCADFDATVVLGRPGEAAPGILFLHGGPHSAYAASYVHSVAFLASLGYNIVIPNYRWVPCWSTQTPGHSL